MKEKPISRFRGEYRFLSNFYNARFKYEGIRYPTSEHAYQERKTLDEERRKEIREAPTAFMSAKIGRREDTVLRPDWDAIKGDVMLPIVRAKFQQNPDLVKKLIDTGDTYLIEGNYWHDNFFGICTCKECNEKGQGLNMLGRILMKVRDELSAIKHKCAPWYHAGDDTFACVICGLVRKSPPSGGDLVDYKEGMPAPVRKVTP